MNDMKEFFQVLFSFDPKKIFYTPTQNSFLQFFRYGFVGAVATVADWGVLYLLTEFAKIPYLISCVPAFLIGLTVNYLLSRFFVFSGEKNKHSASTEFVVYGIIGVIGLLLTVAIMYLLTQILRLPHYMISKIISTVVVFVWNFGARKVVLYR